ncbi:MAG: GIY-YIG nuclease family protein [Candidatus Paceibacterota bacterium]|jgi:hypothetical protein
MKTNPSVFLTWQGYYDYDIENVEKYVLKEPRLPGVYKIAELQEFSSLTPFFIGKTDDLYKTLMRHLGDLETNTCLKKEMKDKICCFKFSALMNEKEQNDVLFTMFEHYHPICNNKDDIPPADLVEINFQ